MTEPAFAAVSPVFTVDGDVAHDLGRDCLRLEIDEGIEGLRTMQAHFVAVGAGAPGPPGQMLYLDGSEIDFGKPIQVSIGPDGAQRTVFDGLISAIQVTFGDSEPPRVLILAEDALMKLRMTRRMHSYRNVTDRDIADTIAREHGLRSDVSVDGPSYDVVQQLNQSDLAFLRERARLVQAELWCTGQTLHFSSRPQRSGTSLTLVKDADLLSARLCADLAHQRTEVVITGYDASAKAVIDERAESDTIDAEISGGRTGPQILERALGATTSFRVREVALTSDEAQAWARAEMLRRSRRFVTVTGVTRGSPDMVVGSRLTLSLVGDPFEGDGYYATRVRHTFDHTAGLRTHFEADRPTLNEVA
jgi:phage protein D